MICWSIGLAPAILLALTWPGHLGPTLIFAKSYAAPVVAVEIAVIIISLMEGYRLARPPAVIIACLAALLIVAWHGALTAESPGASILFTAIWCIHLAYGFALANLVATCRIDRNELIRAIVAGYAIFLTMFVAFIIWSYAPDKDWVHAIPAFGHLRWFGYYCAAIVGFCAWGTSRGSPFYFVVGTTALAAALWTGSRGALAAVVGAYLVGCALFPFLRRGAKRILVLILAAILLSVLLAAVLPLDGQGPGRILTANGDNGRFDVWLKAVAAIEQRPWFGWGEAQFNHLIAPQIFAQPHNVVLQILLAWGVCGIILVLVPAARLALRLVHSATEDDAPYLVAMLTIAALSLVDGSLYHVQSVSMFVVCIALLVSSDRQAQNSGSRAAVIPADRRP